MSKIVKRPQQVDTTVDPGLENETNPVKYKFTSDDFFNRLESGMLDLPADYKWDLIFIDGLHEYNQLTKDCANYYPKLKEGGIFAGHDYNAIAGVRQAADEFAAKVGREIHFTECDVWYWIK